MAAPRKPSNVLELSGSFKTHPERKRPNEPEARGPFPKTAPRILGLSKEEKRVWKWIVGMVPLGVLKGSDVATVAVATRLMHKFITNEIKPPELNRLSVELGKLGLSPSDRAKLQVEKGKANKFDD